jgi:4,5-dihydroxyphthalate decarboxylase
MLLAGDIDCMISATPPLGARGAHPQVVPLFSDPRTADENYFRETGVFPIMHLIVLRRDIYERHPWAAMNLVLAFEEAKRRSVERLMQTSSRFAMPWARDHMMQAQALLFGDGEYWPYGLESNRRTLEAFLTYCYEQGICRRKLAPEELFAPQTLTRTKH